jgi:topoisomerase-4 subunit A
LNKELKKTFEYLEKLTDYTIQYFYDILNKYGKGRERKAEISKFDTIKVKAVAANNVKLYVNRKEGFLGYGIKKDEFVCNCSDIDDVIAFCADGTYKIVKIQEKVFIGKNIVLCQLWKKSDNRMVFNSIYYEGKSKYSFVKRFQVISSSKERMYNVTKDNKGSKLLYLESRPNGESEVVSVHVHASQKARIKLFDYDFSNIEIKGKGAKGNILSKYRIRVIKHKSIGLSSLSGIIINYDKFIGRLNSDGRGDFVGKFNGDDLILVIYKDGNYELTSFELTNRYDYNNVLFLSKFDLKGVLSAVYYDGKLKSYYVKRFCIETTTPNKKFTFISLNKGSKLEYATFKLEEIIIFKYYKNKNLESVELDVGKFIDIKGWKAIGNKISYNKIRSGSFSFLKSKEVINEKKNKVRNDEADDNFNVGESVELDLEPDQLNLFNEKD